MTSRFLILIGLLFTLHTKSSSQTKHLSKDLYIIECKILKNESDEQIYPTCLTPSGNRVDLTAYLNLQLHYASKCMEMGYEGNSFFDILLNEQHAFDTIPTFRELCPEESLKKQVEEILKKVSAIHLPDSSNRLLLKINTILIWRELQKAEMPIIIQLMPVSPKENKKNKK